MRIQGRADRDVKESGKREVRSYAINQNFPSQIGTAIDPLAAEKMRQGRGLEPPFGPTDGMGQGPGANREVMKCGSQHCDDD
jgi:hypothetical protein